MTTAICIASGPSLTRDDVDFCKGKGKIYAVKEAHILAPWADVLYCADDDWIDNKKGVPDFAGEKWSVNDRAKSRWGWNHVFGTSSIDWGDDISCIAYGGNSGFQAINLAVVQGASKVILLGYDYGFTRRKHFYDGTAHDRVSRFSNYPDWLTRIDRAAKLIPVPVINCSSASAIKCFPRMSIREALADV